jgi:hypothetical protein
MAGPRSPTFFGSALVHHRWGEGHSGLHLAQCSRERSAIQPLQGLQAQPAAWANNNLDLVAFPQTSLT